MVAATGAKINVPVIANCVALGNDIFLEHVLYNTSAMLHAAWGSTFGTKPTVLPPIRRPDGPVQPMFGMHLRAGVRPEQPLSIAEPLDGFDPDAFSRREIHDEHLERQRLVQLIEVYAPDLPFEGTTGAPVCGPRHLSCLPWSTPTSCALPSPTSATRWMRSTGWATMRTGMADLDAVERRGNPFRRARSMPFEPTNAPCQIWGITQWRVKDGHRPAGVAAVQRIRPDDANCQVQDMTND